MQWACPLGCLGQQLPLASAWTMTDVLAPSSMKSRPRSPLSSRHGSTAPLEDHSPRQACLFRKTHCSLLLGQYTHMKTQCCGPPFLAAPLSTGIRRSTVGPGTREDMSHLPYKRVHCAGACSDRSTCSSGGVHRAATSHCFVCCPHSPRATFLVGTAVARSPTGSPFAEGGQGDASASLWCSSEAHLVSSAAQSRLAC